LNLTRLVCRVLAQTLGYELDIQRGLHERGKRVSLSLLERIKKLLGGVLKEVRKDLNCERRSCGGYLGVDKDEA
jgi:hypothetical protein